MAEQIIKAWSKMDAEILNSHNFFPSNQNQQNFKIKTKPFSAIPATKNCKLRAQTAKIKPKRNGKCVKKKERKKRSRLIKEEGQKDNRSRMRGEIE